MNKRIKLDHQQSVIKIPWGRLIACLPQLDCVDLIDSSITLGRSPECEIVIYKSKFLPDQLFFISKKHFEIKKDPNDDYIVYITDHSKNGTYINSRLIGRRNRIILQNNDSISIGEQLLVYTYKSMNYATDENYMPEELKLKYAPSRLLGRGGCGEVRLMYNIITCKPYAVKKMFKGRNTSSMIDGINHPIRIKTEIEILQSLNHPLVVKMEDIAETDNEIFIVLEYLQGGELTSKISSKNPLSESQAKFFFYQIVLAVQYLHSQGVTHRDLKPSNVLLRDSQPYSLLKLTDFGLSKITDGYDMKTMCGTWHFIAPEVLNPYIKVYNSQVDVWSLGVILFSLLSGQLPFLTEDKSLLMKLILSGKYTMNDRIWTNISSSSRDLVKKMLVVDSKKRITIDDILKHPWITTDNLMKIQVEKLMTSVEGESDYG